MLHDVGLLWTVALGLWLLVDASSQLRRRWEVLPTALLGVATSLWAGGEFLIVHAQEPGEVVLGRRLLYLGTSILPIAWAYTAAEAARPRWFRHARWLAACVALPQAVLYALLYTDAHAWFVHLTQKPARFGPLFPIHVALGWCLIAVGAVYFVRAATRMGKAHPLRIATISIGTALPFLGNLLYLATGGVERHPDPTPLLLGLGILAIRFAVIDSGLTAFLPIARSDVVEQLHTGVILADLEGAVVDANPAAVHMLGDDDLLNADLDALVARLRVDAGHAIEVEVLPVSSASGPAGRCAVLNDRTEAQRTEQQLQQAQKLEAVGYLTAGIAHEINNPLAYLNANLGSLEELLLGLDDAAVQRALGAKYEPLAAEAPELVTEMRDGLDRISRLVERLGRFARGSSSDTLSGPVDLCAVAERAGALAGVGLPCGAIRTRLESARPVQANEDALVQIATNLLVNAVQASGASPDIEVEVRPDADGVALIVHDRGPGIPEDVLPNVFDPFFTTKRPGEGTGLGLSLSFDLARRYGGTLRATPRPGGGTSFTLWLPASADASA